MTRIIVARPLLSARVAAVESRTEAFGRQNFGNRQRGAAVELHLPTVPSANQALLAEVLLDLCLRMDPVIGEVRIVSGNTAAAQLVDNAARRFPLERQASHDADIEAIPFAIGSSELPFVDAGDWSVGFNTPVACGLGAFPAGAFLGALEAAKHLFLRAVAIAYQSKIDQIGWSRPRIFDVWRWAWSAIDDEPAPRLLVLPREASVALVGCGGVAGGYLWFLRKTAIRGDLLLIDDDVVKWHNMNRLPYATIGDADAGRLKVHAAADYMAGAWAVRPVARKAEHDEAVAALKACASAGGLLACAVGEPETRKFVGRRGFERFFDAGTNSDGWARVLALLPGVSKCPECQVQSRAGHRPDGCGNADNAAFAGVVPHLAAYAGVLLALEHARVLLGGPVLAGVNTQSIMMDLEPATRTSTERCQACPSLPR